MAETIAADGADEAHDAGEGAFRQPAPPVPADLSMVVLSVGDMPALRRYYRALGWQEQTGASDTLSIFRLGGVALALHPAGETAAAASAGSSAGRDEPVDPALPDRPDVTLVVRVAEGEQVDTACSSAVEAGAHLVSAPRDQPWGGRSALVADPEGNRWEVLWVPRVDRSTPAPAPEG